HQRPNLFGLRRSDDFSFAAERSKCRQGSPIFGQSTWRTSDLQVAALTPTGGLARLFLKPRIEVGAIADGCQKCCRFHERDITRRMPGRTAAERPALQQDYVSDPDLGQMVSDAASNHAASNDDDARARRNAHLPPHARRTKTVACLIHTLWILYTVRLGPQA